MMASIPARRLLLAALLLVTACGDRPKPQDGQEQQQQSEAAPPQFPAPQPGTPAAMPDNAANNPLLRKAAVQQAIYRALKTGQSQRWEDEGLSGYAVPSLETMANGCRTVRYTVDQRPDDPMMTINACDAAK